MRMKIVEQILSNMKESVVTVAELKRMLPKQEPQHPHGSAGIS